MTLEAYGPQRFDETSLRLLDACTRLRALAVRMRQEQLPSVNLHDRKALEWLEKLEGWLFDAETEVRRAISKDVGRRKAREAQSPQRREA